VHKRTGQYQVNWLLNSIQFPNHIKYRVEWGGMSQLGEMGQIIFLYANGEQNDILKIFQP
jgi:hypothetical protein